MSSTEETTNSLSEQTRNEKIEKIMRCAKCLNHGDLVPVKDHKNYCPWKECQCDKCSLIDERRRIMAAQVALRRRQCIEERMKKRNKSEIQNNSETNNESYYKSKTDFNNNNEERADEQSRKNIWKSSQQLTTELYSMMSSEMMNEEIALSAAFALLKEKRNVNLTLSAIRNAGEELKKLRESFSSPNMKIIERENKAITEKSEERSVSLPKGPELAQMQLSNYYYYQRMSPYYRKLYNFPSGPNVYPFSFHAHDSVLQNFLASPTLNGSQHIITRNNTSPINSTLNISSLNKSSTAQSKMN